MLQYVQMGMKMKTLAQYLNIYYGFTFQLEPPLDHIVTLL